MNEKKHEFPNVVKSDAPTCAPVPVTKLVVVKHRKPLSKEQQVAIAEEVKQQLGPDMGVIVVDSTIDIEFHRGN